ncbi:TraR/DksA C4-type zinc finger protein [Spiribacter halobius]|uniref:Conjugal transfer protein TraR n=1 Tax=Sediminicurvatus halobius TaxID=2182432 RepID=A0A2U2MY45_9GAMM|nr:TraR/DksA C4-type zinc finger protein [Spiribacter halobius]PWG61737.1 conjugal transfer protein TraR [Spiribacter halobius]UEX76833.1 TraR/DksA C4-type zinc finger protein [Spiribacter halobius]
MADAADIATERTEAAIEEALASRQRYAGHSATHCDECDAALPERRRELIPGVRLCVECQEMEERRR